MDLWGKRFIHRVAVLGNYNPARLQLLTCSLDAAVECTLRIEGYDYPSCWHAVLSKIAVLGNVALSRHTGAFEVRFCSGELSSSVLCVR